MECLAITDASSKVTSFGKQQQSCFKLQAFQSQDSVSQFFFVTFVKAGNFINFKSVSNLEVDNIIRNICWTNLFSTVLMWKRSRDNWD